MGKTMAEKILSAKLGREATAGEICFLPIDGVMTHDVGTVGVASLLEQYGTSKLADGVEMVVILDHFVPAATLLQSVSHQKTREFVRRWGVKNFYEIGRGGVCHQVMLENGHAGPGMLIVATDAHATTYGGVGCMGLGVGVTDTAMALHTGEMWVAVPESIGVCLHGRLEKADAKDLAIYILGLIPFAELNYRVVEFFGEGIASLSMDDRFCLCNMLSEGGVKSCLVECDQRTARYMEDVGRPAGVALAPDGDASYFRRYDIDLGEMMPMLAIPHHPTRALPLREAGEIAIQQAFLGSCTNGRLEDLRIGAEIVRGKQVHPDVRFIVTPASQRVYMQAMEEGLLQAFTAAGAMITNPSCGACIGASSLLAPGEVCVSSSNRNFRGRMGSVDGQIYLASPRTVANSALAGKIVTAGKGLTE